MSCACVDLCMSCLREGAGSEVLLEVASGYSCRMAGREVEGDGGERRRSRDAGGLH